MVKKSNPKDNNGTGYGNPPKKSQWKKGQSGNPAGKPKKSASIEAKLKMLAKKEIVVIENGTQVSMTQDEAMLVAVLMKAMKGDMAAVKFVTQTLADDDSSEAQIPSLKLTCEDLNVLKTRADWIGILEQAEAEMDGAAAITHENKETQNEYDSF